MPEVPGKSIEENWFNIQQKIQDQLGNDPEGVYKIE